MPGRGNSECKDPEVRGSVAGVRNGKKVWLGFREWAGEGGRRFWGAGPGLVDCAQDFSLSPASRVTPPLGMT